MPQIFIDGTHVGGYDELAELERAGEARSAARGNRGAGQRCRRMTVASERSFRAGLVQLRSGRSVAPNMAAAEALIRRAAKGGAVYVQTPENTAIMELETERLLSAARGRGQERRRSSGCRRSPRSSASGCISARSASSFGRARSPTAPISSLRTATIAARYDKLHLFDVDLAGGESYRESRTFDPAPRPCSPICPGGVSA